MSASADQIGAEQAPLLFDSEFLRKLERLEWLARKNLRGLPRGEHSTARRGRGLEFDDFRRYQPGDDFRYIDWNIFSRLDRLVVKLYASEEDMTLHLVLDSSASMGFGDPLKFDYARRLTAALGYIGLNNLDRVALSTFADGLGPSLPALKTRHQLTTLLDFLQELKCAQPTRFGAAMRELAVRTGRAGSRAGLGAGLVVVITDMLGFDDGEDGLAALRHRGHDVVVMQVLSEEEIAPPLDGALHLVDAEGGEALRVTVDARLRELYQTRLQAHLENIERYCRRSGTEYLRASTAIAFEDVVLRYLRKGTHLR